MTGRRVAWPGLSSPPALTRRTPTKGSALRLCGGRRTPLVAYAPSLSWAPPGWAVPTNILGLTGGYSPVSGYIYMKINWLVLRRTLNFSPVSSTRVTSYKRNESRIFASKLGNRSEVEILFRPRHQAIPGERKTGWTAPPASASSLRHFAQCRIRVEIGIKARGVA